MASTSAELITSGSEVREAQKTQELEAREIRHVDDAAWDALMRSHPASRCVVPKWEELADWTNHAIGVYAGARLVGGVEIALRRIPKLPLGLSRISQILLAEGRELECLELLLREIERFSFRKRAIETELRLRIPATDGIEGYEHHAKMHALLRDHGYAPLQHTDTTYLVPIAKDDDALLAQCIAKTRNKIRRAQKLGAVVTASHDYSLLQDFYEAYLDMETRKSAPIPPRKLIGDGLVPLLEKNVAIMVTECYAEKVANMVIVDALGIPCYTLGARSKANVAGEVTGQAQVIHFEIMRMLRARGKRYYDLGGCEGPVPIQGHPNFGVWHFKYGLGGEFVRFLPYYRKVRGTLLRPVMDAVHRLRGDFV